MGEVPTPNDGQSKQQLFGTAGVFGNKEEFCARIVRLLGQRCSDMTWQSSDPVTALGKQTRSEILKALYLADISIDELVPLALTPAQLNDFASEAATRVTVLSETSVERERIVTLLLQLEALEAVTRSPDPLPPGDARRVRALRARFRPHATDHDSSHSDQRPDRLLQEDGADLMPPLP